MSEYCKRIRHPLAVLAFAAILSAVAPSIAATDFSLPDLEGRIHRLSDYRGKWVVINFWATWCGPCRKLRKVIHGIEDQLDEEVVVIAASVDQGGGGVVRNYISQKEPNGDSKVIDLMMTPEFLKAIKPYSAIATIPKLVWIDSNGNVIEVEAGASAQWILARAKTIP